MADGSERDELVPTPHLVGARIQGQIGELQKRRFFASLPPQECPHPRFQFAHGEGLAQIVVSPRIQTSNALFYFTERCKQQDRHENMVSSQATEQVEAIHGG